MDVLLLEDDRHVATGLARVGKLMGCRMTVTHALGPARQALLAGHFDAVIIDLGLAGGESGFELVRWMRAHRPDVRRILISGAVEGSNLLIDREQFIPKPFGRVELQTVLFGAPA